MNRLSLARRTQIIGALVEGNSIRSIERMTDTHRDTVMRLLVQVGEGSGREGALRIRRYDPTIPPPPRPQRRLGRPRHRPHTPR